MAWSHIYQNDKRTAFKGSIFLIAFILVVVLFQFFKSLYSPNDDVSYTIAHVDSTNYLHDSSRIRFEFNGQFMDTTVVLTPRELFRSKMFVRFSSPNYRQFFLLTDTLPIGNLEYGKTWNSLTEEMYIIKQY